MTRAKWTPYGRAKWIPHMSGGLTVDRSGNEWKVYANGRELCANTTPFHYAYDASNRDTDGACDCLNRRASK